MPYIPRELERKFLEADRFFKAVLVIGARQVGKSTMLKHLARQQRRTVVTMDDDYARELAVNDPRLFFQTYKPPILIDEIQKAPNLLEHIKILCDESEERGRFAASAYQKALELKELTDELFKYFLVFGRAELELSLERYDARLLIEQLVGEAVFDLSDAGFETAQVDFTGECSVVADPMYLKRVMDNLISNAKKYADRSDPVVFRSELRDGTLRVRVSNTVAPKAARVESTRIGLRTCEKIMRAMSGGFSTRADEHSFTAEFSLPAQEEKE